MIAEDYRRKAQLIAELTVLAIKEEDFSKIDEYLAETKLAIENMRKLNRGLAASKQ